MPAMKGPDWAHGFLEQARSDYGVYELLVATEAVAACHELHLLQMTTEKLSKALLLYGGRDVRQVHRAFVKALRLLRRSRELAEALGMSTKALAAYVVEALPFAEALERLAPAESGGGPNVEYPWKTSAGAVEVPAQHEFGLQGELRGPRGVKLLRVVETLLERGDTIVA